MYKPIWQEEFKRLNPDVNEMDARKERLAVDVMIDTKEAEMKVSPKAIKYEEDRRKELHDYREELKQKDNRRQLEIERAKKFAEKFLANRMKRNVDKLRRI